MSEWTSLVLVLLLGSAVLLPGVYVARAVKERAWERHVRAALVLVAMGRHPSSHRPRRTVLSVIKGGME